jgi:alpha-L-rhamnosidase
MLQVAAPTFELHRPGEALGIGEASPRVSWRFLSSSPNWLQLSYTIQIYLNEFTSNQSPTSYKIKSPDSVLVPWPTKPLESKEKAWVRVKAFGVEGCEDTDWSEWATVETGILEKKDWKATFIEAPRTLSFGGSLRPALFRKEFKLKGAVKSARLYATAHGVYEVLINGKKVGDQFLAPGWTSYKYHLNYQTFDVTDLLKKGENAIGAEVAEGWWAGRLAWEERWRYIYGDTLGLLAQLEIETEDGAKVVVCSDGSWKTSSGPRVGAEIYNGETYDSTQELAGWSSADFEAEKWSAVTTAGLGQAKLQAPEGPPVRETETVSIKQIFRSGSGQVVLDFGQNLVGFLRVKVSGPRGHSITLHHAEVLENNEICTRPLRSARATDTLILSGKSMVWEPKFTFHGFRYAQIDNWPSHGGEPGMKDIEAVVIHTDLEPTGFFNCSHAMINKLHSNIRWGMRGNFVSIPTDCPQRDERLGWTGDLQVFCPTASFLYNTAGMLSGWLKDLTVEQKDLNGIVSNVVPNPLPAEHNRPQAAWCDSSIMTPWDLYNAFGDIEVLRSQYTSMKDWLIRGLRRKPNGLWDESERQLGDWLDPDAPHDYPEQGKTPPYYVANAYLVHVTNLITAISSLLGLEEESKNWAAEASRLKKLFQDEYMTPNGRLAPDTQTSIALAVGFSLFANSAQIAYAGERLDTIVRTNNFRIGTGFVGTPVILHVLREVGRTGLAYRMLEESGCPSWLYPITMGATTQWERWDSMLPNGQVNPGGMTSFNHYALGSAASFLHQTVGGIAPLEPGYKTILFAPEPGGSVTSAQASFLSPYGVVRCEWELRDNGDGTRGFWMRVVVPMNTSAVVRLPGVSRMEGNRVGSGKFYVVLYLLKR